jgi:NAD-dependent SIR2 family protein deacetylase
VIEVNTVDTPLSSVAQISLRGSAGEMLPQLLDQALAASA